MSHNVNFTYVRCNWQNLLNTWYVVEAQLIFKLQPDEINQTNTEIEIWFFLKTHTHSSIERRMYLLAICKLWCLISLRNFVMFKLSTLNFRISSLSPWYSILVEKKCAITNELTVLTVLTIWKLVLNDYLIVSVAFCLVREYEYLTQIGRHNYRCTHCSKVWGYHAKAF